jgi:hypothetical protein
VTWNLGGWIEKVGVESGSVQLARRRELDGVVECGGVVDGDGSEADRWKQRKCAGGPEVGVVKLRRRLVPAA